MNHEENDEARIDDKDEIDRGITNLGNMFQQFQQMQAMSQPKSQQQQDNNETYQNQSQPKPAQNKQPQVAQVTLEDVFETFFDSYFLPSVLILIDELAFIDKQKQNPQFITKKKVLQKFEIYQGQLKSHLYTLLKMMEWNKIQMGQYGDKINYMIQQQNQLLIQSKQYQFPEITNRIQERISALKQEIVKINNKSPKDYFFEYKATYVKLFGSYESNFNSGVSKSKNTIIYYHDQETFDELFTLFCKRHKQYINFTGYLSENMKIERGSQIDDFLSKLEIGKEMREQIFKGSACVNLHEFLNLFYLPITFDTLHLKQKIQYETDLENLMQQIQKSLEIEEEQLKQIQSGKKIFKRIKKKEIEVQGDILQKRIIYYNKVYEKLQKQVESVWIPLPIYQIQQEQRFQQENTFVDPMTIKIVIKSIINPTKNQFKLQYSLANSILKISKETEFEKSSTFNMTVDAKFANVNDLIQAIEQAHLDVKIFYKGGFLGMSTEVYGKTQIPLNKLKQMTSYKGQVKISDQSQLEYEIHTRFPVEELKNQNLVNVITIEKEFPELRLDEGVQEAVQKFLPQAMSGFEKMKLTGESQIQQEDKMYKQSMIKQKQEVNQPSSHYHPNSNFDAQNSVHQNQNQQGNLTNQQQNSQYQQPQQQQQQQQQNYSQYQQTSQQQQSSQFNQNSITNQQVVQSQTNYQQQGQPVVNPLDFFMEMAQGLQTANKVLNEKEEVTEVTDADIDKFNQLEKTQKPIKAENDFCLIVKSDETDNLLKENVVGNLEENYLLEPFLSTKQMCYKFLVEYQKFVNVNLEQSSFKGAERKAAQKIADTYFKQERQLKNKQLLDFPYTQEMIDVEEQMLIIYEQLGLKSYIDFQRKKLSFIKK